MAARASAVSLPSALESPALEEVLSLLLADGHFTLKVAVELAA